MQSVGDDRIAVHEKARYKFKCGKCKQNRHVCIYCGSRGFIIFNLSEQFRRIFFVFFHLNTPKILAVFYIIEHSKVFVNRFYSKK